MSFGKGSNTATTSPNAGAMAAYQQLLARASGVAGQPYTPYTGELVAPVNAQQMLAGTGINQNAGFALPFINQAANWQTQAAAPISADDIARYQSPYTQQVVDATQAQFARGNAQQQNNLVGNAAAQHALGGDRIGVAQAQLAGQQQTAQAPVIAGLYNQGYQSALQTALQEQQNLGNAAYGMANLGVAGQNAALTGAGAQLGFGSLQQQYQQALDAANYNQFQIGQAFPYQQTQWLAGLDSGIGPLMGSTTTGPKPSLLGQLAGLGLGGLSLVGGTGGFAPGGWGSQLYGKIFSNRGGRVAGFDSGGAVDGMPYAGVAGYVPRVSIASGRGMPSAVPAAAVDPLRQANEITSLVKGLHLDGSNAGGFYGGSPETNPNLVPIGERKRGGFVGLPRFDSGGVAKGDFEGIRANYPGGEDDLGLAGFAPSSGGDSLSPRNWLSFQYDNGGPSGTFPAYIEPEAVAAPAPGFALPYADPDGAGPSGYLPPALRQPRFTPPPDDDPGALPLNATPTGGVVPEGGFGAPASQSGGFSPGWSALLAAGLGMMASKSPFPLTAIGEGGLAGLQTYTGEQKRLEDMRHTKVSEGQTDKRIELESKRLAQAAEQAAAHLKLQTEQLEETKRQHRDVLDKPPVGYRRTDTGMEFIPGGPADPEVVLAQTRAKNSGVFSDAAIEIGARQIINGDLSPLTNVGRGQQGDARILALRNKGAELLVNELGMTPAEAAAHMSSKIQAFKASGIGQSAEARTAGTREANLNIILKATDAAIPAAIEASEKLGRTGFVPLNRLIQAGQVITSNPELREFGMANLQLAEHWARAMNPTGVMRESDREKALQFLSTADSPETYKRAVLQLQRQIQRERDAVAKQREPVPGGAAPSEVHAPAPAGSGPAIPAGAIERLKKNPHERAQFDAIFGAGAAAKVLGE